MDTSHWKEVYHVKATPVRVVGKDFHHSAGSVLYNSIRFLYAIKCSSGHDVPSKTAIFEIFIFAGLGVTSTSGPSGEFISMGSSGRLPLQVSFREVMMGLMGWLVPVSCVFFLSSLLLSTND